MAVEAQRLIALSLGKISQSRQQRGGINLHKNLLVASVLYKARTAFILENSRSSRSESESSDEETTTTFERYEKEHSDQGALVSGTDHPDEPDSVSSSSELDQVVPECEDMDKENSFPDNEDSEVFDQENNSSSEYTSIGGNCKKCQKRRLTDVDSEYTSHDSATDSVVSKKPRLELAESQRDNQFAQCEQEQSNGQEPVHITTLVNSFNSGFTGLLNTDSTSCNPKEGYVSSSPQGQGHSSDSLISCSTQIKEAFETLARPILALTV